MKTKQSNPKKNPHVRRQRMGTGLHDGVTFTSHPQFLAARTTKPVRLANGNGSKYDPDTESIRTVRHSGPRPSKPLTKLPPVSITAIATQSHEANRKSSTPPHGGSFGGVTKAVRAAKDKLVGRNA